MPGQVRRILDCHLGHPSFSPAPFHRTQYATSSPNVFVNDPETLNGSGDNYGAVRLGDITFCTDPAAEASPDVYANNIRVHRKWDATGGHDSWIPNFALTASDNVFVNGDDSYKKVPSPD